MRVKSLAVLAGALLALSPVAATAQRAGAVELGGFGRYTWFDSDLNFDNDVGIGGRLGIFVVRNLSVEADASYTHTLSADRLNIRSIPLHGRMVYNAPLGEHSAFLLGGGYTRQLFRTGYRETSSGVGGLAGFRLGMGELLSIRLDLTGDYISDPASGDTPVQLASVNHADKNWHWGLQTGLSFLFGAAHRDGDRDHDGVRDSVDQCPATPAGDRVDASGCSLPKDSDGDGVTDNLDRCPATPAGERVDATGCTLPKDADGDGVTDDLDKCANTPAGTAVDASGCPRDTDGDGVWDSKDQCPNTAAGTPVDANGCARDSDGDGVTDDLDKCANTPAGTAVDASGCPKDSDGDGVVDSADRCPGTAAGATVDANGCVSVFQAGQALVLEGVTFETGKAVIKPESEEVLDRVAQSLIDNPTVTVEVGGHTDNVGSAATNTRLSQARADAVKAYLVGKGIDADRMTTKGYGPTKPVAPNTTAQGRAANRRVELNRTN